ncbi:MAG: response regulator [Candidatus Uhrbacteria bacterium]
MRRKLVILMVEDDKFFAEICERHFAIHKYQTKVAKNFIEADKKIKRAGPDIIIVDIALEEQSGLKWIKNLRAEELTAKIPIVVLTGLGDRDSIQQALETGANKYFLKSQITPHELAEQVSEMSKGEMTNIK